MSVLLSNANFSYVLLKIGGKFITASDDILSNQLLNGFSTLTVPTGDQTKDPIQVWQIIAGKLPQGLSIMNINVSFLSHL